ncbi:MAG TPA: substrate-binding domain-containing protein [Anaerolineae bacterium]|nr:substrate-binding domain-containing protein [Anaerolineae bacterium]
MKIRPLSVIVCLMIVAMIASACAPAAAPAPAQPTQPAAAQPTSAPAAATLPSFPTAAPGGPVHLRLATTTSTQDSGLLDNILPDFEKLCNCKVDVVAVGTGQAIAIGQKGDADILLVHARSQEDQFVKDQNAKERFDVMYNDFIILGPKDDPAKVASAASAKDAFKAIMDAQATFASRGDKSGTNTKELSIWSSIGVTPTKDLPWYKALGQGMGETLTFANEQKAYTLSDRGTYLSQKDKLPDLAILLGGNTLAENKDKSLLNPYGVLAVNPDKHPGVNYDLAMQFVKWITSVDEQQKIGDYGKDKVGQSLFYPSSAEWKAAHPN